MIQKLGIENKCASPNNKTNTEENCFNYIDENTNNFIELETEEIFNYTTSEGTREEGIHSSYNQNGFQKMVNLKSPSEFYSSIKTIKDTNWVKNLCKFFSINLSFYNFNLNCLILVNIFYERITGKFYPNLKIHIINKNTLFDELTIATFLFALFTIITSVIMILRDSKSKKEVSNKLKEDYEKYLYFQKLNRIEHEIYFISFCKYMFYNMLYFFQVYFIAPNTFLIISKY